MNQVQNELMHFGVLGMKWGKRSASGASIKKTVGDRVRETARYTKNSTLHPILTSKAANASIRDEKLGTQFRRMYGGQKTKEVRDVNDRVDSMVGQKKARSTAVKAQAKELNKQASIGEKLIYNNATRKKAAKYIVDNNMTVAEATKKAKGDAWRNTAIFIGANSAVTVAALHLQNR